MKIYLVGGAVRDKLLGLPLKEKDYVVVGATPQELLALGYRQVGKEFPVFLHPETGEEYALARKERKVAPGYAGFVFEASPEVNLEEDLLRRDLTINAMAEDENGQLIDPYLGQKDLAHKSLRHVSAAFSEDPVRILRIARFAARYARLEFQVAPETILLMKEMVAAKEVDALVAERVWKELERALSESSPAVFFEVLNACEALPVLFPEVKPKGEGIAALKRAVILSQDTQVRFAALMYESESAITALCERYRLPTEYRVLALLVSASLPLLNRPTPLSADELLALFSKSDAFRRQERFQKLLLSAEAILQKPPFLKISEAYAVAKAVPRQRLGEARYARP